MKNKYSPLFSILIFIFWVNFTQAQTFVGDFDFNNKDQTHLLLFKNGDQKIGRILSIKNIDLDFLETEKSESSLFKLHELDKIIVITGDLESYNSDPLKNYADSIQMPSSSLAESQRGNNRLFYAETGFCMKTGQSEYNTIWGIVHNVDHAITNDLTMGIGFITEGYITGHLKFNYITKYLHSKFRAGFDFKFAAKPERFFDDDDQRTRFRWEGYFQLSPYFSYGTPNRNAHISINVIPLFDGEDFLDGGLVTFSFGGNVKLSPHWKLIYENTFGVLEANAASFGFFSGIGVNWFDDKNSIKAGIHPSSNFGFFNIPINELNSIARLPFLSYSRFF